ncbi:MAG: glycosyl hydrolase family 79 C-terminal domain-containing protein [Solirubrobacteraceae bacterium]
MTGGPPQARVVRALLLAGLAVVAAAVVLGDPFATPDSDAALRIPTSAVRVQVIGAPTSRQVRPGFIGFSIEYWASQAYSGFDAAALNPTFIALVRGLTAGAPPVIRFGGDTTDWTWWPTRGVSKPPGVHYTITPRWLAVTRASAIAMGARLILGINFEADRRAIARTEARALLRGIGRGLIAGFELGNEPEVYGTIGWYTSSSGVSVFGRRRDYGFRSFLRDYTTIASVLPRGVPLVGPASGASPWLDGLNQYLAANPRVRIVTFHRYPLHRCHTNRGSPTYPTIPNLLSLDASIGPAKSLSAAVAVAHAHGLQFRADELNSVSCGGARGVSNTFAAALWSLDALFHMAQVGVDGVNIHTFANALYAPFAFSHPHGAWQAHVTPMYYGLLMFTRAAPPGSRLLSTYAPRSNGDTLRVWATRGVKGTVRIVLINDSPTRAVTVAVRPPIASASATLERLVAPRLRATNGVTIAGQGFGAATATGVLPGTPSTVSLEPIQNRYLVTVAPGSVAMLSVPPS